MISNRNARLFLTSMAAACMAVCTLSISGCRGENEKEPRVEDARNIEEDMSWGPVQMTITVEPAKVDLASDSIVTLKIVAPPKIKVSIPSLENRVEGFAVGGTYDDEPVQENGKTILVRHVRLSPLISRKYRLKPIPVSYVDGSVDPPRSEWFPTKPVVLNAANPTGGVQGDGIKADMQPVWIYPPFKTVALWIGAGVAFVAGLFLIWKLTRKIRRHVELMRLSPRERALRELEMLFAEDLPGKHKVKEFYLKLTMIVRRYIERQHSVRAPEQTTEEFLHSIADHPHFGAAVANKLRSFLEAADLVKFAAFNPTREAIQNAGSTAKEYIKSDASAEKENDR